MIFGDPEKQSVEMWSGMTGIYFEVSHPDEGVSSACLEDDQAVALFEKLSELLAARRAKGFVSE